MAALTETAKAMKHRLPIFIQKPIDRAGRFVVSRWHSLTGPIRHRIGLERDALFSDPDFPRKFFRLRTTKWDYVEWLASDQVHFEWGHLRAFKIPLSATIALYLFRGSRKGRTLHVPPSQRVKARAIHSHARRFSTRTFIETGTFKGETVSAMSRVFDDCTTIELSDAYWRSTSEALRHLVNVNFVHGDSGAELARIVPTLDRPALFWLDAHVSGGDTAGTKGGPIFQELRSIFASGLPHVILIDDARGHPVEEIRAFVPDSHAFAVRNDIMRITPLRPSTSP